MLVLVAKKQCSTLSSINNGKCYIWIEILFHMKRSPKGRPYEFLCYLCDTRLVEEYYSTCSSHF